MDVYSVEDNSDTMSSPNIYETVDDEEVIEVPSTVIESLPIPPTIDGLTDRELLVAVYKQQELIGNQLNWLCENLAGVFGMVTAVSQNGGGLRGMMKMMKEMNANG
jgi:hypothetical protein